MSGTQYRMIPDTRLGSSVVIGGKKVSAAANTVLDMPIEAANTTQGWVSCGLSGTTAMRPANPKAGDPFIDTTLTKVVFADQYGNWHDPFSGAIV